MPTPKQQGSQPRKPTTAGQPPRKAPARTARGSKSIVNAKQRPWGLIVTTAVIALFAIGVVGYAVTRSGSSGTKPGSGDAAAGGGAQTQSATATAEQIAAIQGITIRTITDRNHVPGVVDYGADSPPLGGNHNALWADCTGTVYPNAIANENAVHTLEHGAIWITYKPGLDQASIDMLAKKVNGINYMLMSPYPGLNTAIAVQSWGHQLFLDEASDPRIDEFIKDLRLNPTTTPEYGASCSSPYFKSSESTPGHPYAG